MRKEKRVVGTLISRIGKLYHVVKTDFEQIWKRHINQMRMVDTNTLLQSNNNTVQDADAFMDNNVPITSDMNLDVRNTFLLCPRSCSVSVFFFLFHSTKFIDVRRRPVSSIQFTSCSVNPILNFAQYMQALQMSGPRFLTLLLQFVCFVIEKRIGFLTPF